MAASELEESFIAKRPEVFNERQQPSNEYDKPLSENERPQVVDDDQRPSLSLGGFIWKELTRCYSLQNDVTRYTEKRKKMCLFGWLLRVRKWTTADTCDFLKAAIVVFASFLMQIVDTSVMYHQVRGQGVIKLYIFYNMLEVADKLFSSFGQDTLDALFWTATERASNPFRTLTHFLAAVVYALLHTLLVLLQATTLNVAFNSHNQALLAIMMSNNFVELKGSVFKKFGKPNLFQMSCSDVRERFHIMILLSVVVVRNMMAVNWKLDHLVEMLPDLAMVVIAELMVDWLKHAFITKFNEIPAEVYRDFTITIAYDVVQSRDEDAFSDYSDQVSRRMGFIPIPLTIMLIRVLTQSLTLTTKPALLLFGMAWFLLLTVKILNGIIMLGKACEYVTAYRNLQAKAEYEIYRRRLLMKKSKSVPSSPRMSLVDFSDVLHQTAATKGGFTVSDVMSHWDELCRPAEVTPVPEAPTPRRTQSLANFSRPRRDNSLPPPAIPECEEKEEMSEVGDATKATPKRRPRPNECDESLSGVQAYTMLNNAPESVGEIQS
ncbi:Protein TAPT1 -like protein [Toxocara canis]|nr:Protein TAPT1 -like protein [Toxocara canis]